MCLFHDIFCVLYILPGKSWKKQTLCYYYLYLNRSVAGKPSHEPEKTHKKYIQKEGSFAGPSAGRALPPKKRKASSEELLIPVRLIWLTYVLTFQSNST
jgi:hypothetical protein